MANNESPEHKKVKRIIKELKMVKVKPLKLCDDVSILSDYYGFEKETYEDKFKGLQLISEGTLIFDRLGTEDSILAAFDVKPTRRPDILAYIGNQEFAIEVVKTHDIDINTEDGREKYKTYFLRHTNVLRINISNKTMEDIINGDFIAEWSLSEYAQHFINNIWRATFPALIKDDEDKQTYKYGHDMHLQCYRTKLQTSNGSIMSITLDKCKANRNALDKDGRLNRFVCKNAIYADKVDERIFRAKETACIHCYQWDNPIDKTDSGRKGNHTTFDKYISQLKEEINNQFINGINLFDDKFKEWKEQKK